MVKGNVNDRPGCKETGTDQRELIELDIKLIL